MAKGFTKASRKLYPIYSGDNYEVQLPRYMVEQMVQQALNKFGYDVATAATTKEAQNLAESYQNYLIESELTRYKESAKTAEELSIALIKGRQLVNDPIGFALDKAKEKIRKDYQVSNAFGGLLNKEIAWRYAGQQALETTLNVVSNYADAAINRYTTLQEDYLTGQAYSNVKDTINRTKQLGGSIIGGMTSGFATAGVAGAAIGAVKGVVSFGANQYLEYQQKMSSYYQQLNATNFQTSFSSARLGLVNNGRGTEN